MIRSEVLILDCPEIGCPKVLRIVFWEFCGAFTRKGHKVRFIDRIGDIHDDAIVLMGDVFRAEDPGKRLAAVSTRATYIGWYWHKQDTSMLPFFLHIYENVLSADPLPDKVEVLRFMRQTPNSCPLLLRANEDPSRIGTYPRQAIYDYCFMGGRMCEWMVPSHKFRGIYIGEHDTDRYVAYDDRRAVYLRSTFALGFQTDDNIRNGHVSQRIYEAMAYGCVVLSHSAHASTQTEGIVELVGPSSEESAQRMSLFFQNPHLITEKQERGHEFDRWNGTNESAYELITSRLTAWQKPPSQTQRRPG